MTTTYNGSMFDEWHLEDLVTLIRQRYPDWDSFEHPPFVADEIRPKQETIDKARQLLGPNAVQTLLAGWQYNEFLSRLEQLGKDNNLLWNRVPSQGDLAILYRPDLDKAEFALHMQRLLYGRLPTPQRIQQFSNYAGRHLLPNKWAFSTYFLFITNPEEELFLKPQVAQWFLKFMGLGEEYSPYPTGDLYALLRARAHRLWDILQEYRPRDMVDIQSFLWICARESQALTAGLDLEGQIALDAPEMVKEYGTRANPRLLHEPAFTEEEQELPAVSELLEPLFQAFKLLNGAGSVLQLETKVAEILALTGAQQAVLQNPGQNSQTRLAYRLGWARTRLKGRDLIESVERGFWQLTEKGESLEFADDAELAEQIQARQKSLLENDNVLDGSLRLHEQGPGYKMAGLEPYSLEQLSAETGQPEANLARWIQALQRKGQAILYGPPGTGKTFLAQHLARFLAAGNEGLVDLVQFHPAYAYEDFIQGIRPLTGPDGTLSYEMVPGRFLQFCKAARQRQGTCVLVIDEINRANLARVFGELMYLLEYRDQSIPLAGGGTFSIPPNVILIGTMNTADRSIALVDHALRRRFAFIPLRPDYELLRRYHEQAKTEFPVEPLIALLERINQQISDPHYSLGITYFLRPDLQEQFAGIWQMEVLPYLEEYFFDRPEKVDPFRWQQIKPTLFSS